MTIEEAATLYPLAPRAACAVIARLAQARGSVVNRWQLCEAIENATGTEAADTALSVRKAVQFARAAGAKITTRRGLGYALTDWQDPQPAPPKLAD